MPFVSVLLGNFSVSVTLFLFCARDAFGARVSAPWDCTWRKFFGARDWADLVRSVPGGVCCGAKKGGSVPET